MNFILSFFVDVRYHLDLGSSIKEFINQTKSNIFLVDAYGKQEFLINPKIDDSIDKFSCIYSPIEASITADKQENLSIILQSNIQNSSIAIRSEIIKWLSINSQWSITVWGGVGDFKTLLFITNEVNLKDVFTRQLIKYNNIPTDSINAYYLDKKPIVSEINDIIIRNVETKNFKNSCHTILFQESILDIGSRVWDACNFDKCSPWIVSMCGDPSSYDFYAQTSPCDEFDETYTSYWDCADYTPITVIHVNKIPVGVYKPKDKRSFMYMCQSIYQGNEDLLVIVPSESNLDILVAILEKTEIIGQYYNDVYSPLVNAVDIISLVEWFYGLNRCHGDEQYSLFSARDNVLVQEIDNLSRNDGYTFVSCF